MGFPGKGRNRKEEGSSPGFHQPIGNKSEYHTEEWKWTHVAECRLENVGSLSYKS